MKLQSIQALRGFAAFAVMMTHLVSFEQLAAQENGYTGNRLLGGLWENGYSGVDLFFVISGFVMVYVTAGKPRNATGVGEFFFARATRIYPLWWLFAAIMAIVFLIVHGTPWHPDELTKTQSGATEYLLKSFFLVPQDVLPVLGVGWTLIHEMYFYFVFALFLFLPERFLPFLLASWLGLVLLAFANGFTSTNPDTLLHLATYPMTAEFVLGTFAGLAFVKLNPHWSLGLALISGAAFLASMIFFVNSASADAGIWATLKWGRVIFFGIPAVVLVYAAAQLERSGKLKLPSWIVRLGDMSYALYLSHTIVLILVKRSFEDASHALADIGAPSFLTNFVTVGAPGYTGNVAFVIVSISASIIVAHYSFRLFERPLLGLFKSARKRFFISKTQRRSAPPSI